MLCAGRAPFAQLQELDRFGFPLTYLSSPALTMAVVDLFLGVVKAVVFIYDLVTFPVYQVSDILSLNKFCTSCMNWIIF